MINQEELTNILERKDQLAKFLDIKTKKEKLDLLDSKMIQNNFWDNPKEAEKILKDKKEVEQWINLYLRDVSPRRLDRARVRRARARAGRERVRVAVRADARVVDEGAGTSHANPVRGGHIAGVRGDGTDAGERGDGERDGVGKPDARAGAVRRADGTSVDVRVQRNARESGKGRVRAEWDIGVRHRDAQRHRTGWIPEGDGGTRGRGFFGLAGAAQVRGERRA